MTHRIGAKGQVVLPRQLREQLALAPGVEVDFELRDGGVLVQRHATEGSGLGGRFAESGMADRLLEDRLKERR